MRLMPLSPAAARYALGVQRAPVRSFGAFSLTGHAGPLRSVTEGAYSSALAGQQIYQTQCGECHRNAMEGVANCHTVYRDKGGPEGSGGARCQ